MAKTTTTRKPRVKAQDTPEKFLNASLSLIEGAGVLGSKPRPNNYDAMVRAFTSWVFAAAKINALAVAQNPVRLYVRKRSGRKCLWNTRGVSRATKRYVYGDAKSRPSVTVMTKVAAFGDDFEEITDNIPVLNVLRAVNPFQDGFGFAYLRILYGELTGNAYLHPIMAGGQPSELWLLPPQWTSVIPSRTNFIDGYAYGQVKTQITKFEPDEVIHFKRPHPNNMFYGMGNVEAGWGCINLNTANHEMDLALADNHARPDYAVIFKTGYDDNTLKRFEANVNGLLQGRRNAGKMLALSSDATLTPLNFPPKDMGGRDEVVEEIAAVFGVPVSKLKANDPNRANAEQGDYAWLKGTIQPLCVMDEEVLNQKFLPLFGIEADAVLAYDNPVPEDETKAISKNVQYVTSGIYTPNEVRIDDGKEPLEGADSLRQPQPSFPFPTAPLTNGGGTAIASPASPAADTQPAEHAAQEIQTTEATVLNGAQISSAKDIVMAVAGGTLPRDSGIAMLQTFFNLKIDVAEAIMGSAGTGTATTPNVNPKEEANAPAIETTPPAPPADETKTLRYSDICFGRSCRECKCHHEPTGTNTRLGKFLSSLELKADATDTVREDERESPIIRFQRTLEKYFGEMNRAVLVAYGTDGKSVKLLKEPDIDLLLRGYSDPMRTELEPILREILATGGTSGLSAIGLPPGVWDVSSPTVAEFAAKYTPKLVGQIQETTLSEITRLLSEGYQSGSTTAEMGARIADAGTFSGYRGEMIARTESARAFVEGEKEAWRQSDVVEGVQWFLAPDACEFCAAAAAEFGNKTQPLDQPFYKLGDTITGSDGSQMAVDYMDITGPPLHPHDRCDLIPVLKGD